MGSFTPSDNTNSTNNAEPAFEALRQHRIDSLGVDIEEYRHRDTGALHYHFSADKDENVFLVALRTVPEDSTGVAHILEHTALCGSEKYPVRDPFFMMIRRSLNTFMNAFTSSDWTAYPFASQNKKDFNNLLSVYLDAVFFSRLDPLDFAQEGHRLEFEQADDPSSPLQYKGVVYNEMKGAMSSINSQLWQFLCQHLHPTTTYHHNSGGEPTAIPELSHEQLKTFYQRHYHPSNAVFFTFGNIPAAEHQAQFQTQALVRFSAQDSDISVAKEQRFSAPRSAIEHYPLPEAEATGSNSHVLVAWLLGESANLEQQLEAQLLSSVLLDNSASPLQKALETTELGRSPSPLCGLEDSQRELIFVCGLEGCADTQDPAEVEQLILDTLQDVATNGVEQAQVEAVLHQLELHQREIGGDGYPYGLQLILNSLTAAIHRADPLHILDIEPVLEKLRSNIQDPNYIKGLAQALLDNPHRLRLSVQPDTGLAEKRQQEEQAKLQSIQSALSEEQTQNIIDIAKALEARQNEGEDESILPKVGLADVPAQLPELEHSKTTLSGLPCREYAQGTNGLVYQQLITALPVLDQDALNILPLYNSLATELGLGERDYLQTQQWQSQVCGSINHYSSIRGSVDDPQQTSGYHVLSSKALYGKHREQAELMQANIDSLRFDELGRIRELISQMRSRREMSITGSGHSLAMTAASAGLSPLAALQHSNGGLEAIRRIKALDDSLANEQALANFAGSLSELHGQLQNADRQMLLIAEAERLAAISQDIGPIWQKLAQRDASQALALPAAKDSGNSLWLGNTQVNFCARAFPTVAMNHADAPALTVLGGFLRNGFLHRAIREQGGAYGGGASQDSNLGVFRFYSYRDPRLEQTLDDFDGAITWLLNEKHEKEALEQAILGVIGSLDKPGSPAGEAKHDFHSELFGRSHALRQSFRERILQVGIEDLRSVAERYLVEDKARTAVLSYSENPELDAAAERFAMRRELI